MQIWRDDDAAVTANRGGVWGKDWGGGGGRGGEGLVLRLNTCLHTPAGATESRPDSDWRSLSGCLPPQPERPNTDSCQTRCE